VSEIDGELAATYAVAEGPYAGRYGFFRSRWVKPPVGVELLHPSILAPGFRAAGIHCGLKQGGGTDLGVVVCDEPAVRSSLLLTRNAAAAAPVRVCRELCELRSIRAAIVNSGNANAATGEQGYGDALRMRDETAAALGLEAAQVAVAETGVIGVPLDIDSVSAGIGQVCEAASETGGESFGAAIRTTDRWSKRCSLKLGGVTLSAQAKGAGMIEPGYATMLCFIQTDAVIDDPEPLLRGAVADSFERITVDGQMSTNDTVLLQASGLSGKPLPEGLLEAVLLQLALEIVADGEGSTRVGRAEVLDAASPEEAERAVRAIGNSPLIKTALLGRDPNWGRIAQAAGQALAGEQLAELGPEHIEAGELASEDAEAELSVRLDRGMHRAHLYFSDLTHEYIRINAEYTT
jgi:glutamate N-acetyltransferase/amino-acid N-acetyltransferase